MKKTTIIALVLGILVIISVVQSFQLYGLKEKIADGELSLSSSSSSTGLATSSGKETGSLPANLQNLPEMVGGC